MEVQSRHGTTNLVGYRRHDQLSSISFLGKLATYCQNLYVVLISALLGYVVNIRDSRAM